MDMQKSGQLIADARKELGLTQTQLAESIGVTDKAISRWETGRGFPDVAYLQPLSQALGISITEIVNGERIQTDTNITTQPVPSAKKRRNWPIITVLVLVYLIAARLYAPKLVAGFTTPHFWLISLVLGALAAILFYWKIAPPPKACQYIAAGMCAVALVLQALPISVVSILRGPNWEHIRYHSCFDLTLMRETLFPRCGPIFSGVMTIVVLVMMGFILWGKRIRLQNACLICTLLSGFFMSIIVLIGWSNYITAGTVAVILLLLSSALLQLKVLVRPKFSQNSPNIPKFCRDMSMIFCIIAFLLQALPLSAIGISRSYVQEKVTYLSCFDSDLFGLYGRVAPFISGTLTAAVLAMSGFILSGRYNHWRKAAFICTILSGFFMSLAFLKDIPTHVSPGAIAVITLLFSAAIFQARARKA